MSNDDNTGPISPDIKETATQWATQALEATQHCHPNEDDCNLIKHSYIPNLAATSPAWKTPEATRDGTASPQTTATATPSPHSHLVEKRPGPTHRHPGSPSQPGRPTTNFRPPSQPGRTLLKSSPIHDRNPGTPPQARGARKRPNTLPHKRRQIQSRKSGKGIR